MQRCLKLFHRQSLCEHPQQELGMTHPVLGTGAASNAASPSREFLTLRNDYLGAPPLIERVTDSLHLPKGHKVKSPALCTSFFFLKSDPSPADWKRCCSAGSTANTLQWHLKSSAAAGLLICAPCPANLLPSLGWSEWMNALENDWRHHTLASLSCLCSKSYSYTKQFHNLCLYFKPKACSILENS